MSTSPAAAFAMLGTVTETLATATGEISVPVRADPAELIAGRAALTGFSRGGRVSAGGSSILLRAADGWCAVTLSRPEDLASVPAIGGVLGVDVAKLAGAVPSVHDRGGNGSGGADPGEGAGADWARGVLARVALGTSAADLAAAAQLLGVPAAALPRVRRAADAGRSAPGAAGRGEWPVRPGDWAGGGWPPWRTERIAPPLTGAGLAGAVVVDLSSMWAGPLCGRLLGLAGAEVIKVEAAGRPDGARGGNREFFDWLHAGQRSVAVDFRTREGRAALAGLLAAADVVIEASRPRALAALGLAPAMIPHRDGQVWLSITGYGQAAPDLVAFGDDAAVAGGLVGWVGGPDDNDTNGGRGDNGDRGLTARDGGASAEPVFCADAVADPLTGVCGALAVARSRAGGGGERIDLGMRDVAAAFASASVPWHGRHQVLPDGSVRCPRSGRVQPVLAPRRPVVTGVPGALRVPGAFGETVSPGGAGSRAPELGADNGAVFSWLAASFRLGGGGRG